MSALVVETCQRAGVLDIREFYNLPQWVQALHLGHTANLITGAYRSDKSGSKPTGTPAAEVARIVAAQRRHHEQKQAATP